MGFSGRIAESALKEKVSLIRILVQGTYRQTALRTLFMK